VNLVQIAAWLPIQDNGVGAQPFQASVFLRLKDLTHDRNIVIADGAHEQNW